MKGENILEVYMRDTYHRTIEKLQASQKERNDITLGGYTIPQSNRYTKLLNKYKQSS